MSLLFHAKSREQSSPNHSIASSFFWCTDAAKRKKKNALLLRTLPIFLKIQSPGLDEITIFLCVAAAGADWARKESKGKRDNKSICLRDTGVEKEEQDGGASGLVPASLHAAVNKSLLGTERGPAAASALSGKPESNCSAVLYSKGNFLGGGKRPLSNTEPQFPWLCKASD